MILDTKQFMNEVRSMSIQFLDIQGTSAISQKEPSAIWHDKNNENGQLFEFKKKSKISIDSISNAHIYLKQLNKASEKYIPIF